MTPLFQLHIIEVSQPPEGNKHFAKKAVDVMYPSDVSGDVPSGMQVGELVIRLLFFTSFVSSFQISSQGIIYLITRFGYLYVFDIDSGTLIHTVRASTETVFLTAEHSSTHGIIGVNRAGQVGFASIISQSHH